MLWIKRKEKKLPLLGTSMWHSKERKRENCHKIEKKRNVLDYGCDPKTKQKKTKPKPKESYCNLPFRYSCLVCMNRSTHLRSHSQKGITFQKRGKKLNCLFMKTNWYGPQKHGVSCIIVEGRTGIYVYIHNKFSWVVKNFLCKLLQEKKKKKKRGDVERE